MSDCEFTVDGLEDLINDFNKIVKELPGCGGKRAVSASWEVERGCK